MEGLILSLNQLQALVPTIQIWGVAVGGKSITDEKFVFQNENFVMDLIAEAKLHKASDAFFHKDYVTLNGITMKNSKFEKIK